MYTVTKKSRLPFYYLVSDASFPDELPLFSLALFSLSAAIPSLMLLLIC